MSSYEIWQMSCGCFGSPKVREKLIGVVEADTSENAEILGRTFVQPGIRIETQIKEPVL